MSDPKQVTVRCSAITNDGQRCDRKLTVHVFYKYRDHYCHLHDAGDE